MQSSGSDKKPDSPGDDGQSGLSSDRRDFLSTVSTVAMAGGLVAGYGTLAAMAGRYIFPVETPTPWLFVAVADGIGPGESLAFESPTGVKVTIARRAAEGPKQPAVTADFIALSSVCPHLGCRVHWEAHNRRFFCPCHNGEFDAQGKPVSGPPKAAEQELSRYPIKVEAGLLYIGMSLESVGRSDRSSLHGAVRDKVSPPGHTAGPEGMA